MHGLAIFLAIVNVIIGIALIAIVIMQEGNTQGLGAIGGGAETFFGKNKGCSIDALLKKVTSVLAVAFIIISIILNFIVNK